MKDNILIIQILIMVIVTVFSCFLNNVTKEKRLIFISSVQSINESIYVACQDSL